MADVQHVTRTPRMRKADRVRYDSAINGSFQTMSETIPLRVSDMQQDTAGEWDGEVYRPVRDKWVDIMVKVYVGNVTSDARVELQIKKGGVWVHFNRIQARAVNNHVCQLVESIEVKKGDEIRIAVDGLLAPTITYYSGPGHTTVQFNEATLLTES